MQERCLGQYLILPMDSLKSERPWWLNRRSKPECMARFGLVGRRLMGIILTRRRKVTSTTSLSTLPTAHSLCFPRLVTTEAQPSLPVRPHCDSPSNSLSIRPGTALVVFGFLDLLPNHTQCLFQETGGFLAVRPFESHGVNLDFARDPDDDFDSSVHDMLRAHEQEFDGSVLLWSSKNGQPLLPRLQRSLVDAVELQELILSRTPFRRDPAKDPP